MKLAEAILERDALETRLGTLESRLLEDKRAGGPTRHISEEIQQTANRARDLSIAISWTETVNNLSGLPFSAHRIKIDMFNRLASAFEAADRERADEFWKAAVENERILMAAQWLVDLQVPDIESVSATNSDKEVDT